MLRRKTTQYFIGAETMSIPDTTAQGKRLPNQPSNLDRQFTPFRVTGTDKPSLFGPS